MKTALAFCAALLAAPAAAQTFDVVLGGKVLGTLDLSEHSGTQTLTSDLASTPMGVFNGTFKGTSAGGVFTGDSRSSRKTRLVEVTLSAGRPASVQITPTDERTALSDPTKVSQIVTDPVRAIGGLVNAQGCPTATAFYDGRRVVQLTPSGEALSDSQRICDMRYTVVQGPGHLSPLKISNAKIRLTYDTAGGQSLQQMRISSGVFRLNLNRRD